MSGRGEVHQFLALRRDREIGGGDVALAGGKRRQQLVAPHRDEYHPHLQVLVLEFLLGGELLVELVLEQPEEIDDGAALHALVQEIEGLAVDGQHADDPPLDHPVQIAGPRLPHEIDGESRARRFLWRLLVGERGIPRQNATAGQAEHDGYEVRYECSVHGWGFQNRDAFAFDWFAHFTPSISSSRHVVRITARALACSPRAVGEGQQVLLSLVRRESMFLP